MPMRFRWLVFFSMLGALLLYTGVQAMRLWPGHPWAAWALTIVLFVLMFSWQFIARAGAARMDSASFRALAWIGSILLGIWATFILFWLPVDLARDVYGLFSALVSAGRHPLMSGEPGVRWMAAGLFVLSMGLGGLGLGEALSGPRVVETVVPLPDEAAALDGLKIAQLSDLHIGPMIRRGYVEDVVRRVQALEPDLIAVTGDLADGAVGVLERQVAPLSGLHAPLGVFFVTGNHEYYWGAEAWLRKVAALGMTPLVNEGRVVAWNGTPLLVGGVTDLQADHFIPDHRSDPQKAARAAEPVAFRLLLAHRPTSCEAAEPLGFNLQLSGHTHGGQFFPFSLLIPFFYKYFRGLNRHGKLWIYVNPGTGYWGPPHRFLVPAEITLLRLKRITSH